MGYAYYEKKMMELSQTNNNDVMLAIRQEHLAEDWDKLEEAFGTAVNHHPPHREDESPLMVMNATVRFKTLSWNAHQNIMKQQGTSSSTGPLLELSEKGRLNLCAALRDEIQAYKRLLLLAENLDVDQVRESLEEVVASCGAALSSHGI